MPCSKLTCGVDGDEVDTLVLGLYALQQVADTVADGSQRELADLAARRQWDEELRQAIAVLNAHL